MTQAEKDAESERREKIKRECAELAIVECLMQKPLGHALDAMVYALTRLRKRQIICTEHEDRPYLLCDTYKRLLAERGIEWY